MRAATLVPVKAFADAKGRLRGHLSDAERARLLKARSDLEKPLAAVRAKLNNASFVERAPAEVVQQQRDREAELVAQLAQVEALIAAL